MLSRVGLTDLEPEPEERMLPCMAVGTMRPGDVHHYGMSITQRARTR